MTTPTRPAVNLARYAWLSMAAAVATIGLKYLAYAVTGSVGLLSDAAESVVNLVAAIIAVVALRAAARPPDASHHYGHGKAEYFSAGLEGVMSRTVGGPRQGAQHAHPRRGRPHAGTSRGGR